VGVISYHELVSSACECEYHDPGWKKKTQKVNCDEKCVTEDIVKSPTAKLNNVVEYATMPYSSFLVVHKIMP